MLANQGGLDPLCDKPLARPRDRVDTGLQRRRDLAVAPALTTVRGVGFQQDPVLKQFLCWRVSAMDQGGEMPSLLIAQCHYVFLYRDLFPGHQSAPSAATEPSNQTNTAESMTGATRLIVLPARPASELTRKMCENPYIETAGGASCKGEKGERGTEQQHTGGLRHGLWRLGGCR